MHHKAEIKPRPAGIEYFALLLLLLTMLSGNFTLERIDIKYKNIGMIGQPRLWLLCALFITTIILIYKQNVEKGICYENIYNQTILWLLMVIYFHIYMCISSMWSPEGVYNSASIISLLIIIVILIIAFYITRLKPEENILIFLKMFYFLALVFCAGGLLGKDYFGENGRLAFLWGGPNVYIRIVGTGSVIALFLWAKTQNKLWLVGLPPLLAAAFLTGSRGGMIALLVAWLLTFLFIIRDVKKWLIVVLFLALLFLAITYLPSYKDYVEFAASRYPLNTTKILETYEHSRELWFNLSYEAFKLNPILGIGLNGLRSYGISYSHNIILNIAAEGGSIGIILFFLTLLILVCRFRSYRAEEHNISFIIGVLFLIASMFSGTYYDWRYIWLFFLLFMLPSKKKNEYIKHRLAVKRI